MTVSMENINNSISEVELEGITNFFIRESFDIIDDELDYYFANKEKMVDFFIESIDLNKLNPKALQQGFNEIIYCPKDFNKFISRVEKRIIKELSRSPQFQEDFCFTCHLLNNGQAPNLSIYVKENIKTCYLSNFISKGIDKVWKKTTPKFLPNGLNKLAAKLIVGDYFLDFFGISRQKIMNSSKNKIANVMKGIIRQHKFEMKNILMQEILKKLEANESKELKNILCQQKIMTA